MTPSPGLFPEIPDHPKLNFDDLDKVTFDFSETLEEIRQRVMEKLVQAEEQLYRDGLIALGWTPPDAPLHHEWRVLDDEGLCFSGVMHHEEQARRFAESDRGAGLPATLQRRTVSAWVEVE